MKASLVPTLRLRPHGARLLYGLIALLLLYLALRQISLADLWFSLRRLTLPQLSALALLNLGVLLAMAGRWQLLLYAQGHKLPLRTLLGYRLAVFGVTYFTPGPQLGGEPLQVYLLTRRHQTPITVALVALTLDKLLEMLTNFAFLVGGAWLMVRRQLLAPFYSGQLLLAAGVLLALPVTLFITYTLGYAPLTVLAHWLAHRSKRFSRAGANRMMPLVEVVQQSEAAVSWLCTRRPGFVVLALLITLLGWALMITEFGYSAWVLGLRLAPIQVIAVMLAARVAFLLPMPAGIGALELSLILVAGTLGVAPAQGIALGLYIRARDTLLSVTGLCFGGAGIYSKTTTE
ncbi:MAG: lysylphosphatidylglycerol synthase transmembrane domain-containing protein [Caldilineaceae bacterium]